MRHDKNVNYVLRVVLFDGILDISLAVRVDND